MTPTALPAELAGSGRGHVGQRRRRQPAVDLADDVDAVSSRSSASTTTSRTHRDERSGHERREPPQAKDDRERRQRRPRASRRCVSPRLPSRSQSCSKKSPSPFSTPKSFGTWPTMIVSARPTMKPLSTGSEMKLARKPSRSSPATSATMPGRDRQRRGQRDEGGLALGGESADRCRRQRRGRRHRADDQVARTAERRVQDQRGGRRVQADDGRDAGDRGVRERLRHEHRPDRQAGDQVAAQPRRS